MTLMELNHFSVRNILTYMFVSDASKIRKNFIVREIVTEPKTETQQRRKKRHI